MQAYEYQPLQSGSIRVLHITAATGDCIHAKLEAVELQEGCSGQRYNTPSYCWGAERSTYDIVIDGTTLKVRTNLHKVLLRIRQKTFKLPIWIDAICINQEDEAEKVQQIQLMPQIYSTAESVIIWLGEESSYTRQAAKALKKIERRFIDDGYFDRTQMTRDAERGIGEMLTSPWFSRLWVLQEAIKATRRLVLCGSHCIDLEALGFAAHYFRDNGLIPSYLKDNNTELSLTGFGCIQEIQQFETSIRFGEWWPATDICRERGCSQPKDRIYAIHGIVPGIYERMQGIRSYRFEPTTTVKDLYVPFTAMHLDPLGRTIRTAPAASKDPTLPSWCPDYHQSRIHEPVDLDIRSDMAEEYKKLSGEDVIGRGKPYSWNQNKPKRLFVDALLVDEIEHTVPYSWEPMYTDRRRGRFAGGAPTASERSRANNLEWLAMCTEASHRSLEILRAGRSRMTDNHDLQNDLWEMLSDHRQSPKPARHVTESNSQQCHGLLKDPLSRPLTDNSAYFEEFNAFTVVDALCSGRRFFTTTSGCFGLGPATIKVGDQVVLTRGADMPAVLRRRTRLRSGKIYFKMVGEALVYGYSRSSVLLPDALAQNPKPWQWIVLL